MSTEQRPEGEPSGIFRPEALEHRARQRGPGDVVRVAPRWVGVAFYLLIGLFVVAVIAGLTIEIDGRPVLIALIPGLEALLGGSGG